MKDYSEEKVLGVGVIQSVQIRDILIGGAGALDFSYVSKLRLAIEKRALFR